MSNSQTADSDGTLKVENADVDQQLVDSILKRRSDVLDEDANIESARIQEQISEDGAEKLYKNKVTQYVQDALKLIKGNGFPEWVWPHNEDYTIGTIVVRPPSPIEIAWRKARPPDRIGPSPPTNPTSMPRDYSVTDAPEPVKYQIRGLTEFVGVKTEVDETFTWTISGPQGAEEHTLPVSKPVPRRISRQAFQVTDSLLNLLGVDIGVTEEQKEATGDYSIASIGDISEKFNDE